MPDTIAGPGIGTGASEIAAVSVGVYVVDNTGAGFAAIKAKAAAQGAEVGKAFGQAAAAASGQATAAATGGATSGNVSAAVAAGASGGSADSSAGIFSGISRKMRSAQRMLFGLIAGPMVLAEAYKAGEAIRDALLGGLENDYFKRIEELEKQTSQRFMRIVDSTTKMMDQVNSNLNRVGQNSSFDTEEIKQAAQRFNDINEKIMKDQADTWGAWFRSGPILGGLLGFEQEHNKLMGRLREEQRSLSNELTGLRNRAKRMAQDVADESKRRGAEGAGSINGLAFDIGAIRQMTAIQVAQRTGSIPTGGLASRD